jgi:peptidoglycan/LPS O-acetylase OafA/YrhL
LEFNPEQAARHERRVGYLPHVDGLRALAIVSVVGYHATPANVPGGFVGVDVFFVISGFLITSLLHKDIAGGTFSLADFLARRARRIVPALACVILVSFAAAYFIMSPEEMSEFGRSLASSALFGANFHFYGTTDYFALEAQERPLLHTWSLSIEEQFYLIWPLVLLLLVTRLPRKAAIMVIVGAMAVSLVAFEVYASAEPTYAFYMPHCRAWALLIGALLALTIDRIELSPPVSEILGALGLAGIVATAFLFSDTRPFPGLASLVATLSTAAIIVACNHKQPYAGRLLRFAPLVWIGLISYSLYLWHWPIFSFARLVSPAAPAPLTLSLMVLASVAIAWASWRYVETPLRRRHGRFALSTRAALVSALCLLIAVAGLGVAIKAGDGWAWRLDAPTRAVYAQISTGNERRPSCDGIENIFGDDDYCNFGRRRADGQSYDVAIFGDSNADHFVPMLAVLAKAQGLSGRQVTQSTCAPLLGAWRSSQPAQHEEMCLDYQKGMVAFLKANPGLKLAVLSGNWASYQKGMGSNALGLDGAGGKIPDKTRRSLEQVLDATVRYLHERGIAVLIIGQVPHWQKTGLPIACAIAAKRSGEDVRACGVAASSVRKDLAVSNEAIRRVAARYSDVTALLGTDLLCDTAECYAMMDGVFLYRNPGHLNAAGSELLAKYATLPKLPAAPAAGK